MVRLVGAPAWVYALIALSFGLFFVAFGVVSVYGGASDADWLMSRRKAMFLSWLLGRTGARVAYVLVGLALIVFGSYYIVLALLSLVTG